MDRRKFMGTALTGVLASLAGAAVLGSASAALAQSDSASGSAASDDTKAAAAPQIKEMVEGDANAPVTMIEYGSLTCPHCADFHNEVFTKIKSEYIDTGKVKFIFRDVYFDRYGLWASMIARCDGGKRFFPLVDMFYEQQDKWLRGAKTEKDIADNLRRMGKIAGMTDAQLDQCLNDQDKARALVAWYQKNATDDGITGTPTFIINGQKYSNMSYDDMKKILDEKLKDS